MIFFAVTNDSMLNLRAQSQSASSSLNAFSSGPHNAFGLLHSHGSFSSDSSNQINRLKISCL